jgi:hypothetical protein
VTKQSYRFATENKKQELMLAYTLVAITILSTQSPGVMVNMTPFSEHKACSVTMAAAAQGAAALFEANVQSIHREISVKAADGWTIVKSGTGRELARFKCVDGKTDS